MRVGAGAFKVNDCYDKSSKHSLSEYNNLLTLVVKIIKLFLSKNKVNILYIQPNNYRKFKVYKKILSTFTNWTLSNKFNLITLKRKSFFDKIKSFITK